LKAVGVSNTTTKILAGCGVGCLLAVLVLGGLGWMSYRWARTAAEVVDAAERAEARLEEEYGAIRDYCPPIEGRMSEERVQAFMAVRESTMPQRRRLDETIAGLAPAEGERRTIGGWRAARAGISMAPRIIEFAKARNEALLDVGMGLGEYTWDYWLICHAWLGHPAGESLLEKYMEVRADSEGSVQMQIEGFDPAEARYRLRRDIRAMLRNLEEELAAGSGTAEIHDLVVGELAALDADSHRIAWEDGLPNAFAVGLEPYRDRLEATYSPATNQFELLELD
jgi:hypothetical protein